MDPDPRDDSTTSRPLDDVLARAIPELRAFVSRRLGRRLANRESVSDVIQSACRSLVEDGVPADLDEESIRRRLFRNAQHKLVDHARREFAQRRDAPTESITAGVEPPSKEQMPSDALERRSDVERVLRAIHQLDEIDRDVILLATFLELPHAEIAAQLAISEAAARTRLCRALARLAVALEDR